MSAGTRAARGSGVIAAVLVMAACSSPTSDPSTSSSGSDEPTPEAGGSLVIGVTADADNLVPWLATQFQSVHLLENIYGTLTEFDTELNVIPGLATSWETSSDGTALTLHLREGVTFNDGSEFDSADVKASLDAINLEATAAVARSSLALVTDVEAVDPLTVVLHLSAPDAALPANLASVNMAMLPAEADLTALAATPNGTGPYMFDSRVANQSITLVKNVDYWGEPATLDSIEFRVIPDESSIVSALQSGNVQFAVFDDPLVAQTAASDTVTVTSTPQLAYHVLQLNARRGDLADVNVRLAIQCAIDRQEVLDTAALGEGEVTGPITSPAYKSDPSSRPCPTRDLDKAAEYLAAAGKPDGVTIDTIVSQGEYATSVNEAQNLQAQLAEAKITLNLEVLESGTYVDRWIAADFDAAVALNGGRPDPDGMYGRYFTSTGSLNEVAGYSSPELDALFAQGKSSSDVAERKAIYTQISDNLEANAAWIWMFTSYAYTATDNTVSGFTPMANGSLKTLATTTVG